MSAEDLISGFDPLPVRGVLGSSTERGFHRQHWVNILSYNFSAWVHVWRSYWQTSGRPPRLSVFLQASLNF